MNKWMNQSIMYNYLKLSVLKTVVSYSLNSLQVLACLFCSEELLVWKVLFRGNGPAIVAEGS